MIFQRGGLADPSLYRGAPELKAMFADSQTNTWLVESQGDLQGLHIW